MSVSHTHDSKEKLFCEKKNSKSKRTYAYEAMCVYKLKIK